MPKTDEEIAAEAAANATDAEWEQYPEDHPLIKTLKAQKDQIKQMRADHAVWRAEIGAPADLVKLREKASKLDELEESSKTEAQKLADRAEKAEKALAEREAKDQAQALAAEVAKAKSVDGRVVTASALRGSTREELEAHADEILALLPEPPKAPSADGQGDTGERIGEGDMSADDIVAKATAR